MQSDKNLKSSLFLHMGPGLHSYAERILLSDSLPNVDFWDQPQIYGPTAFSSLVEISVRKVHELSSEIQGPIEIIAHSFGGQIAQAVIRKAPTLVNRLQLFNTGFDYPNAFRRLLNLLRTKVPAPLSRAEIDQHLLDHPIPNANVFWKDLDLITRDPDFMRLYWPSFELYQKYNKIVSNAPRGLDFNSFRNIMEEYLLNQNFNKAFSMNWDGSVTLTLGAQDPLLETESNITYWKSVFPQLDKVQTLSSSGHYSHIEPQLLKWS